MKSSLISLLKELPDGLTDELDKKTNDRQRYDYLLTLLTQEEALSQIFRIKLFHELMKIGAWGKVVTANTKNTQGMLDFAIQLHEGDYLDEPDFDADSYRYHFLIEALQSFPQVIHTLLIQNKPSSRYDYNDSDDESEQNPISETTVQRSLLQNALVNSKPQHNKLKVKLAEIVFTYAVSPPKPTIGHQEILINQQQAMDLGVVSEKVTTHILQEERFNRDITLDDAVQLITAHPNNQAIADIFAKTWRHRLVSACQFLNKKLGVWVAKKMGRDYRAELLQQSKDTPVFVKLASNGGRLAQLVASDHTLSDRLARASSALIQDDFEGHLDGFSGQQLFNLASLPGEAGILWRNCVISTHKFRFKLLQAMGLEGLKHLTGHKYENFASRIVFNMIDESKENAALLEDYVKLGGEISKICQQEIAEQQLQVLQQTLEWPTRLSKYVDLWTEAGIDHIGELFKYKPELWEPKSIYFAQRRASLVTIPELVSSHPNLAIISEAVELIRPIFFKQHAHDDLSEMEASLWRTVTRLIMQDPEAKQREKFLQAENITPALVKSIPLYMDFELAKEQLLKARIVQQNSKIPGKPLLSKPAIAPSLSQRPREVSYADDEALVRRDHQYLSSEWEDNDTEETTTQDELITARRQSKMLDAEGKAGLGNYQRLTPGGTDWITKKAGKSKEELKKLTQDVEATVPAISKWYANHHDSLTRRPTVLNNSKGKKGKGKKVGFEEEATDESPSHKNSHL